MDGRWKEAREESIIGWKNPKASFCDCFAHLIEDLPPRMKYLFLLYVRQEDSEFQNVVSDFSSVNQKQLKRQEPWRTVFLHMYLFLDKCVCLKV